MITSACVGGWIRGKQGVSMLKIVTLLTLSLGLYSATLAPYRAAPMLGFAVSTCPDGGAAPEDPASCPGGYNFSTQCCLIFICPDGATSPENPRSCPVGYNSETGCCLVEEG